MFDLMILMSVHAFPIDPAWKPLAWPLEEAQSGQVKCRIATPDAVGCEATSQWEFAEDGGMTENSIAALNNDPPMALASDMAATQQGDAICSVATSEDMERMTLLRGNVADNGKAGRDLIATVAEAIGPMIVGKNICSHFFERDGRYLEVLTFDGVYREDMSSEFRWVRPDEERVLHASNPIFQ